MRKIRAIFYILLVLSIMAPAAAAGIDTPNDDNPPLILTSPAGGDSWQVGSQHYITWTYDDEDAIENVKIEYSYDNKNSWITIDADVPDTGIYSWTVPNTPSDTCFIRVSDSEAGNPPNSNYDPFSIVSGNVDPVISLNRSELRFAAMKTSTAHTGDQYIIINNTGGGTLQWKVEEITKDAQWLRIYNNTGSQSGMIGVGVEPFGLKPDDYMATLHVTDPNALNSPQTVAIKLIVYDTLTDAPPFGSFDTPVQGTTVMSSVPVTGWALDDIGIDKVIIRRNPVAGESAAGIYIGDAVLVEGARPDIELAYPGYPMNHKAGWGYMLLTNTLPNGGNGTFTFHAYARDLAGTEVLLGSKTVTCDNANAVKPFGAIDTPAQGTIASGTDFRNQGWVLTPLPNKVPVDGSTIRVIIDGQSIGNPYYNIYREDIELLFPGYANSAGAMAYLDFDTTGYDTGLHTIQWLVTDNAGNTDGIGSRYFVTVHNPGYSGQSSQENENRLNTNTNTRNKGALKTGKTRHRYPDILNIPVNRSRTVKFKKGYGKDKPGIIPADRDGIIHITAAQDQRILLHLCRPHEYLRAGYLVNGQGADDTRLQDLPAGSSLDYRQGILYWQVGPGYFGTYNLVFILEDRSGKPGKLEVRVRIVPKFGKK